MALEIEHTLPNGMTITLRRNDGPNDPATTYLVQEILVVYQERQIGVMRLELLIPGRGKKDALLKDILVDEDYRRKTIGSVLLAHAMQLTKGLGIAKLRAVTNDAGLKAFYLASGGTAEATPGQPASTTFTWEPAGFKTVVH